MPKGRRSNNSKKKYRDREAYKDKFDESDDVEMRASGPPEPETGYHSGSSEEEITIIHENRKQRAKRVARESVRRVKEEPGCRTVMFRYCLFLIVLSLGVGMIINLYSTYGEYVSDAIFPPRTSSAGIVCGDGTLKNDYMVKFHTMDLSDTNVSGYGWAWMNATQPKENLLMAWEASGEDRRLLPIEWIDKESLRVRLPNEKTCANFIVWSV